MIMINNKDVRSEDYNYTDTPRPGHADFTANKKYKGFNDDRGGGHFSGRITAGIVIAGVIAKKIIKHIDINAKIIQIGGKTDFQKAVDEAIARKK